MCTRLCTPPNLTRLDLVAGQPGGVGWVDGVGAAVHFADPWTFAGDGAGHLFIADGNTIRTIDAATGEVKTLAGSFAAAAGMDGVGMNASFFAPSGLAYAPGTLYVADTENHTIRKIDVASATVTTWAGAFGAPGTDNGPIAMARFREPEGITLDGNTMYVADTDNNTIRAIDVNAGMVSTIAGSGAMGAMDGTGLIAQFSKPKAIVADGMGNLYVTDSGNGAIRKVTVPGAVVSTLCTFQTQPNGLVLDGTDLVVALGDHTLARVDTTSGTITPYAGASNMMGYVEGAPADARFFTPAGLWKDGTAIYIADEKNEAVRKLAGGMVSTVAGANPIGSNDGTGTAARFFGPTGIAIDSQGIIYAADTNNHTIRRVDPSTGAVTTLAGAAGQMGLTDGNGAGALFNTPSDLALDDDTGTLYVVDTGNRAVRTVDVNTGDVVRFPIGPMMGSGFTTFDYPTGLALEGGKLYVTDYTLHIVAAVDLSTNRASILAGKPRAPGKTDGVGADARLYGPSGIAGDGHGILYVADEFNDAVRKIVIADGTVTTLAGGPGTPGYADGAAADARFNYPSRVTLNGVGDLFVADSLNNSVRHVDLMTGDVTTTIGTPNTPGVKLGPLPSQMSLPTAVALSPDARLFLFSESALLVAE
jgi:sugar lactone lactonase YvrE